MTPTNEPVALTEAVRLVLAALLAVLTVFNVVSLSTEQVGALWGLYAAVSVVLSVVARSKSTPTAKVAMTNDDLAALTKPPAPSVDVDALARAVGSTIAAELQRQTAPTAPTA